MSNNTTKKTTTTAESKEPSKSISEPLKAFGLVLNKTKNEYEVITINYVLEDKKVKVNSFLLDSGSKIEAVALVEVKKKIVRHTLGLD